MTDDTKTLPTQNTQHKPFRTAGESVHKWGTYLGVDWIFNAVTGVSFAYWGKFTDSGKKLWSGPISEGFTKALSPFIKDPALLKASVEKGNIFMSIIAGGMFTIPPLMFLENRKRKRAMIEAIDEKIYGKEATQDPKFQNEYAAIENAPEKKFWSGMTSRFVALSPLLAMVLIPSTSRLSEKYWFRHVAKASDAVARKIGFSEASFAKATAEGAKERWDFTHNSVAMDFGLGVPYAVMHAFFYNKFVGDKRALGEANGHDTPSAFIADKARITPSQPHQEAAR